METKQIAIFIDCDAQNADTYSQVREKCLARGRVVLCNAYGDFEKNARKWVRVSKDHGDLELRYNHAEVRGKNASDILLSVDAIETLFRVPNINEYAVVAQDSDFSVLVRRLRQFGKTVVGFGNKGASRAFKNRCDEFIEVEAKPGKSEEVCRAFMRGSCTKGDACKYRHGQDAATETPQKKRARPRRRERSRPTRASVHNNGFLPPS